MPVEVFVERSRCIGSKVCLSAAPGVFHMDYDNTALVVDPEAAPEQELVRAARDCPTRAISVVKDGRRLA